MFRQTANSKLRLRLRVIRPGQGIPQQKARHRRHLLKALLYTIRLFPRYTRDEQLPLIGQFRRLPCNRDRIGFDRQQLDIRRRYTFRQFLYRQIIDVVIGELTHVHHIGPHDRNHAFRTAVVLKISITTGVTGGV